MLSDNQSSEISEDKATDQEILEEGINTDHEEIYCVFNVGDEEYAIAMSSVKEVVKVPVRTPLPHMPEYFSEMVNIRGEVQSWALHAVRNPYKEL